MKVIYEIESSDIHGLIRIERIEQNKTTIRIEQGAEDRIFLSEDEVQEVIYALREIIGDK